RLMDVSDANMAQYNAELEGSILEFLPQGPCPWDSNSTIGRIMSQAPETDGLTIINRVFDDDYAMVKVRITGYENEMVHGKKV
ncbi:MAG: hypothetical protein GY765_37740, partial [bacterium]|nr:hypothetical protein [bacterium]